MWWYRVFALLPANLRSFVETAAPRTPRWFRAGLWRAGDNPNPVCRYGLRVRASVSRLSSSELAHGQPYPRRLYGDRCGRVHARGGLRHRVQLGRQVPLLRWTRDSFTSNILREAWADYLDEDLGAAALIDRRLHHNGPSYRGRYHKEDLGTARSPADVKTESAPPATSRRGLATLRWCRSPRQAMTGTTRSTARRTAGRGAA